LPIARTWTGADTGDAEIDDPDAGHPDIGRRIAPFFKQPPGICT
jgi:hypothetical protein